MWNKVEKLKIEVEKLNLEVQKDYDRFLEIKKVLYSKFKDKINKGRCAEYDFIIDKFKSSYKNFPSQGYEYFPRMGYYNGYTPRNFKEQQFIFDDLKVELERYKLFGRRSYVEDEEIIK